MKISPIRYMGNKSKLIKKGLCSLFPKNIDTIYDLFGGSGVVAYNTKANQYVINELDNYIYQLHNMFYNIPPNTIIKQVEKYINVYNLPTFSTDVRRKGITKKLREYYKQQYLQTRDDFNNNLTPIKILTLMYYSMSTTIRINSSGKYNMPFGNGYFIKDKHGKQINDYCSWLQTKQVSLCNEDYRVFTNEISIKDFVYLDPPYLNSTATYTENKQWDIESQRELMKFCDLLNSKNIRFGLSNTFMNKGIKNIELQEWVRNKNYKVHFFDDFDYCTFGTGRSKTVEVYIYNY